MQYADSGSTFRGNLSITIEGTITVNFTTQQLLLDDHYIGSNGFIQHNPFLKNVPLVIEDPPLMPRLGGMFFSSAYLMVNHDKNEFTITSARTTRQQPAVVGIDTKNDCIALLNSTTVIETPFPPNTTSPVPEATVSATGSEASRLAAGTIVGITAGVIAGVSFVLGIALIVWRRLHAETNNTAIEKDVFEVFEASLDACKHEVCANGRVRAVESDGGFRPPQLR